MPVDRGRRLVFVPRRQLCQHRFPIKITICTNNDARHRLGRRRSLIVISNNIAILMLNQVQQFAGLKISGKESCSPITKQHRKSVADFSQRCSGILHVNLKPAGLRPDVGLISPCHHCHECVAGSVSDVSHPRSFFTSKRRAFTR